MMQPWLVILACLIAFPAHAAERNNDLGNATILTDQFLEPGGVAKGSEPADGRGDVVGSHMWINTRNPDQLDILYSGLVGTLVFDAAPAAGQTSQAVAGARNRTRSADGRIERAAAMAPYVREALWLLLAMACTLMFIVGIRARMKRRV